MQYFFQQVLDWCISNDMTVNFTKTKEMIMGPPSMTYNLPLIQSAEGQITRVSSFKLLELHLDADFSWHSHDEAVTSKATKHLYFLKQLKRAGIPQSQLLHYYLAVIRPVLEYALPVWHHSLNKNQNKCVSKTDTNPPFAFQIAFPRGTDFTGFLQGGSKSRDL